MARVLIIDDNEAMREGMALTLRKSGHEVLAFRSPLEGVAAQLSAPGELVITDLRMEGLDGLEVVRKIHAADPSTAVMVVTAFGTIETAVKAMREGAFDFLTKPFSNDVLRAKVESGLERVRTQRQLERLSAHKDALESDVAREVGAFVGESEPMQRLLAQARRAAAAEATVHIFGESGTGKELIARRVHDLSPRKDGPFVVVHCASLAESLLESELFGHERGAFTGAVRRKLGRFELAHGGTLFLDEIGEISQTLQTKLLRVLQEKEVQRVGGEQTVKVDVRVVSATNRNLEREMREGRFREDLFYRLHVVPLTLPPLREHPEDIPQLALHFVRKSGPRVNRRVVGLTPEAERALTRYGWPGNVRELENAIEQALVFADGERIGVGDLPAFLRDAPPSPRSDFPRLGSRPLPELLEEIERRLIEEAYAASHQVKTETARRLGIKTSALYYKLEKYGLVQKGIGGGDAPS